MLSITQKGNKLRLVGLLSSLVSISLMILYPKLIENYFLPKFLWNTSLEAPFIPLLIIISFSGAYCLCYLRYGFWAIFTPIIVPSLLVYSVVSFTINTFKRSFKTIQHNYKNITETKPKQGKFGEYTGCFLIITFGIFVGLIPISTTLDILIHQTNIYMFPITFSVQLLGFFCLYLIIDMIVLSFFKRKFYFTNCIINYCMKLPVPIKKMSMIKRGGDKLLQSINVGSGVFGVYFTKTLKIFIGFYYYFSVYIIYLIILGLIIAYYINIFIDVFNNGVSNLIKVQLLGFFSSIGLLPFLLSLLKNLIMGEIAYLFFTILNFFGGVKCISAEVEVLENNKRLTSQRVLYYISNKLLLSDQETRNSS